jgi:hypothetical protein
MNFAISITVIAVVLSGATIAVLAVSSAGSAAMTAAEPPTAWPRAAPRGIIHCSKVSHVVTSTLPEVTASSKWRMSHDVASRPAACPSHNG